MVCTLVMGVGVHVMEDLVEVDESEELVVVGSTVDVTVEGVGVPELACSDHVSRKT